jgi:hypothetical protein
LGRFLWITLALRAVHGKWMRAGMPNIFHTLSCTPELARRTGSAAEQTTRLSLLRAIIFRRAKHY